MGKARGEGKAVKFATEISGYIALAAGEHIIGINSDDGVIMKIGGVEIGRTGEWRGTSNEDIYFTVAETGIYILLAASAQPGPRGLRPTCVLKLFK